MKYDITRVYKPISNCSCGTTSGCAGCNHLKSTDPIALIHATRKDTLESVEAWVEEEQKKWLPTTYELGTFLNDLRTFIIKLKNK